MNATSTQQPETRIQRELRRRMAALNIDGPTELERRAGLREGAAKNILRGKSKNPRADTLQKLAQALGCSVADLTGESHAKQIADDSYMDLSEEANEPDVGLTARIEELDIKASAGAGTLVDGHAVIGQWQIPALVIRGFTSTPDENLKFIPVVGDSMQPTLHPGQRLLVDVIDRIPSPPGIFVLWDGLGFVVKRVEVIPHSDPITVRITSDNPRYTSYERTLDEAYIQGRVIGGWNWL
ncbi:helix-turn-helix domain-containing protein [Azospirillum brasilense]|nr:helix-turn-helix domain-containing protein [Azospirillum brasilense]NUB35688.1 helix-turn-helix domain-containing protein [Azospirillum brasilense]RIV96721.1 helix-turn-helix domain-containing protein [Azospirillum brasilense]